MKILLFDMTVDGLKKTSSDNICRWLDEHGHEYSLFSDEVFRSGHDQGFQDLSENVRDFDLVCSLGGDGTTLRAAHIIGESEVPLLSVNFGNLGFLSGARGNDVFAALEAAGKNELNTDARSIIEVRLEYQDGSSEDHLAFNELVVSRGHFGRIVSLNISINGHFLDSISGDGVLVSTPTGSTAYSLSAGGPIMAPNHEGLCMVPISPHTLASRALITNKTDCIEIVPTVDNRQAPVVFIDGEAFWVHPEGSLSPTGFKPNTANNAGKGEIVRVSLQVAEKKLLLQRYGSYDFYVHISEVFFRGNNAG